MSTYKYCMLKKIKTRWKQLKEWWSIDHVVDLAVDIALLLFDVISSPVLICVRVIRHFIGDWVVGGIKSFVKSIVYWFANKRKIRLERGHGIFRTYWYLILSSPFILLLMTLLLGISIGIAEDFEVMLELLIRGCSGPEDGYWCDIS